MRGCAPSSGFKLASDKNVKEKKTKKNGLKSKKVQGGVNAKIELGACNLMQGQSRACVFRGVLQRRAMAGLLSL